MATSPKCGAVWSLPTDTPAKFKTPSLGKNSQATKSDLYHHSEPSLEGASEEMLPVKVEQVQSQHQQTEHFP